jgi:hypothetical protein
MKLELIQQQWEEDTRLDRSELGEEALRIPKLHSKYYNIYSDERMTLRALERSFRNLKTIKYEYYNGTISQEQLNAQGWEPFQLRILKSDIPMYLESDKELQDLQARIDLQSEKVEFVESIIKTLPARGFNIKAAIDWERFKVGA